MTAGTATPNKDYAVGLARAGAGAIIFGLPLLMTMEMWAIGIHIPPFRLALFTLACFVALVVLSRFGGFERTTTLVEDVLDALAAYAVGILISVVTLALFGLVSSAAPFSQTVGQVAIQSVPTSFGAMIARKQLSGGDSSSDDDSDEPSKDRSVGYASQLFLMLAGALYFAFNVAPTEEVMLIGYTMSGWHGLALVIVAVALLHALVFAVQLAGEHASPKSYPAWRLFLVFTVPGYAVALLVSLYVLWTFGSTDGLGLATLAQIVVVLGFPAAIGAAIARLVI